MTPISGSSCIGRDFQLTKKRRVDIIQATKKKLSAQKMDSTRNITDYPGTLVVWDRKSSIRSRPRRILTPNQKDDYFFPLTRQPLAVHPMIQALGSEAIHFVLTQTVYKFMYDIAILETELVNHGALIVANDQLNLGFPLPLRQDALSIIIDEAYHAYVALDYLNQVEAITDIKRLDPPAQTTVLCAVETVKNKLPKELHLLFELISVCIAEHVLTKDLISIGKDKNVGDFFQLIMADHVLDEGRHATIFAYIFEWVWAKLTLEQRDTLGVLLPEFLKEYLKQDLQKEYDEKILHALGLPLSDVQTIINDSYINTCHVGLNNNNPVVINLITLLQRLNILEHAATKEAFAAYHLI